MRELDFTRNKSAGSCIQHVGGKLPERNFCSQEVYSIAVHSTSKGNQRKYKTLDGIYYIKSRFDYLEVIWKDHLVEVIASQYASICNLPSEVNVVRQGICRLGNEECSYSEAFDRDNYEFLSFYRALSYQEQDTLERAYRHNQGISTIFPLIRDVYNEHSGCDSTAYLLSMMLLDAVVANEDRHLNNFGYARNMETTELKPSPLFDFGLGLFEHDTMYQPGMPLAKAVRKVTMKPWGSKVEKVIDFLQEMYSDFLTSVLPREIDLSEFKFPSVLARRYFIWVNQTLGVKVTEQTK